MTLLVDAHDGPALPQVWPIAAEQKGLWFLHKANPQLGAYHLLFSCTVRSLNGRWPDAAFVQRMIEDYPILRSGFVESVTGVEQKVFADLQPKILHSDARGLSEEVLRSRARDDSRIPFDLAELGLWRVHLYRTAQDCYLAVLVMHHIAFDFWSVGLLLKDVVTRLQGAPSPLAPDEANAFGLHAHKQLGTQRLSELTAYWLQQLRGAPSLHALPLDRARPGKQQFQGASLGFRFSVETSDGIRTLARQLQATPYMVMLAVYAAFLGHWSGSHDNVISTPVANRMARQFRNTLGQFVNTLCLRIQVQPEQTFAELLGHVKEQVVGAIRHQDLPFYKLVEALAPKRDSSHAAIAQIGFSWERLPVLADFADFYSQDGAGREVLAENWQLSTFHVPQQEGQLDLTLEMGGETDGAYEAIFKYNPQLFDTSTLERMSEHLMAMAARLVKAPERTLSDLAQGDAVQQAQWRAMGRGTPRNLGDQSLLQEIERHAQLNADSPAVTDNQRTYTYGQLWQRSERIARALQAQGVMRGDRVGFKLERSAELIPVILGIWRSGACYVPLDPHFPPDRLAYIAADAQLRLLITTTLLDDFGSELPRLHLEDLATSAMDAPPLATVSGDVAYILYTSGSTGKPKGVEVGHPALTNFMFSLCDSLEFGPQTRMLAVTTPSFDISLLELFLPLLTQGQVHVADFPSSRDGALLCQLITQHSINVMQATPATWHMLMDHTQSDSLKAMTILCGGDSLPQKLADRMVAQAHSVWNLYGPTETTIWSSLVRLREGDPVSLGRPIANTGFLVLDEQQRVLPPGVLGELWIAGAGLAEGYWQRPELTTEKFRDDLTDFSPRLYRTGDYVRWNSTNNLDHHGRLDFQVKLRGYRIELEEIEACLLALEGIAQTVVTLFESELGSALVAYVVADETGEPDLATVKNSLRAQLPAYMVPGEYVFLRELPLTANNKIDRKRLPAPTRQVVRTQVTAPRDELEQTLMQMFQSVLRQSEVCIHDDFFDMGGHSLLAVELVGRVNRQLDASLSVGELLDSPSISSLAERIRNTNHASRSNIITLRKGHGRPVWLFHPIGGNVLSYRELSRHLDGSRPVLALQSPGLDAEDSAEVTIEAMASRYLEDIRRVQPQGPYLLGGWCFGGAIAFEVSQQLHAAGQLLEGTFLIDTRAPIAENVPSDADDSTLLSWFARDLATPHGIQWSIDPTLLRARDNNDAFAYVLTEAKSLGILGEYADAEQLARYFETYLANGIALQLYFPPASQLPLLLLLARDEPADYGPHLGWEHLALGTLDVVPMAGDHNSIMYAPQVSAVARQLNKRFLVESVAELEA